MIGSERQRTKRGKSAVQKLTTGEVARRLGMSVSTIRNLIAQGELKAERRNTTSQYRILSNKKATSPQAGRQTYPEMRS